MAFEHEMPGKNPMTPKPPETGQEAPIPAQTGLCPFSFTAIISGIRTSVDGGVKITFDLGDHNTPEAAKLLALRHLVLRITINGEEIDT